MNVLQYKMRSERWLAMKYRRAGKRFRLSFLLSLSILGGTVEQNLHIEYVANVLEKDSVMNLLHLGESPKRRWKGE